MQDKKDELQNNVAFQLGALTASVKSLSDKIDSLPFKDHEERIEKLEQWQNDWKVRGSLLVLIGGAAWTFLSHPVEQLLKVMF